MKSFLFLTILLAGYTIAGNLNTKLVYLKNPAPFSTIDTTEVRTCVCGFPNTDLAEEGRTMAVYKLSEMGFDATKIGNAHNFPGLTNTNVNKACVNRTSWFSHPDKAWVTMNMPAVLMHSMLEGFGKILDGHGWESGDLGIECTPAVSSLGYEIGIISLVLKSTKKDGKKLTEDEIKGYIEQFTQDKIHGKGSRWYAGEKGPETDIGAGVVCNFKFNTTFTDEPEEHLRSFVFTSNEGAHAFGVFPGHIPVNPENGYETLANIKKKSSQIIYKPTSQAVTIGGVVLNNDFEENQTDVRPVLHMPNRFKFEMCTGLLKELTATFGIDDNSFGVAYNEYKASCPMLTNNAKMNFPNYGVELAPMYKMEKFDTTPLDIPLNSNLTGFKTQKYIPQLFDATEHGGIMIENPEYRGQLDERKQAYQDELDAIKNQMEEETADSQNQKNQSPVVDLNLIAQQTDLKNEELNAIKMGEVFSSLAGSAETGDEADNKSEDESPVQFVNDEGVLTNKTQVQPDLIKSDPIKFCEEELKNLEREVIGKNYKTEEEVVEIVRKFMQFCREKCEETVKMTFEDGKVMNLNPSGPILHYTVKKIGVEDLKEAGIHEDSNVFEIHFYNHYFDNQKDALYYIPGTEIVNEWDTFSDLVFQFREFALEFLTNQLTPHSLTGEFYDRLPELLDQRASEGKWEPYIAPTGVMTNHQNTGGDVLIKTFLEDRELDYIYLVIALVNSTPKIKELSGDFYDIIYECWRMGEKYLMVKIMGTRLNFQIMINIFATDDKLDKVIESIADALAEAYLMGDDSVVSIMQAKKIIHDSLFNTAQSEFGMTLTRQTIELPGLEQMSGDQGHEEMYKSDNLEFLYDTYSEYWERSIVIRGFIHDKESLPIVNIFFTTDFFQSEYIIPLDKRGRFTTYIDSIMKECLYHQFLLSKEVARVENPMTPEEDILEAQKLGRYSFKTLLNKVMELLKDRKVYGCIARIEKAESEHDAESGEEIDEDELTRKRYKWEPQIPFDPTGEFTMLRSNTLWNGDISSTCNQGEMSNPLLLNLHSTFLEGDKNGYALTVNQVDQSGKDVKTTYHFVQYQDYAHMRVFTHYIKSIFSNLFSSKAEAPKEDEQKSEE